MRGWGHLQSVGLSCPLGEATFATLEPLFMQIKTVAHGPLRVPFLPAPPLLHSSRLLILLRFVSNLSTIFSTSAFHQRQRQR